MKKYILLIVLFSICCSPSYSQKANRFSINADSIGYLNSICGNFGDDLPVDTLYGPYPYIFFTTKQSRISPDGKYLASTIFVDWPFLLSGTVIVDIEKGKIIKYLVGTHPKWSPDGERIVTSNYIYDVKKDSIIPFPKLPANVSGFYIPEWSHDGKYIYYSTAGVAPAAGMYRSTRDGTDLIPIDFKYGALPYYTDSLILFKSRYEYSEERVYEIFDIRSSQTFFIPVPQLGGIEGIINRMISPDQRMLVADMRYNGSNRLNQLDALCIFDLQTHRLKQILPGQAFRNPYHPSWTPWGTLLVSFACRLDSSYTTWEIDTNGVFLRQLTNKHIIDTPTNVETSNQSNKTWSISSPFPNPTTDEINFEYEFPKDGIIKVLLYDLLGRMIETQSQECQSTRGILTFKFNRSLNTGLYFMKIILPDHTNQMKKISIKN